MRLKTFKPVVVAALALVLAGAVDAWAAPQGAGDGYKTLKRLGGPPRFTPGLKDLTTVQKTFSKPKMQKDVGVLLEKAGIASITPTVVDILSKASPDQMKEVEFPPDGTMVWMAFRRAGKPEIVRTLRWGGKKPFPGWEFIVDDMDKTYTFIVPRQCGNLALVTSEPSREKARLDAERAEKERIEQERLAKERAAAEAARLEAERKEKARLEQERLAGEQAEAAQAEAARQEAARLEAARIEAERVAAEQRRMVGVFIDGLFGKERRSRDENAGGLCAPLFGVKVGMLFQPSPESNWYLAPAFGGALNFDNRGNSSLFGEFEANYRADKNVVGAGVGVWDFNHSDWVAPTLLVHFLREIQQDPKGNKLFFIGEGRLFLNRMDETANNYQFWAGIRYVVR